MACTQRVHPCGSRSRPPGQIEHQFVCAHGRATSHQVNERLTRRLPVLQTHLHDRTSGGRRARLDVVDRPGRSTDDEGCIRTWRKDNAPLLEALIQV
jgi:hypothetical protein